CGSRPGLPGLPSEAQLGHLPAQPFATAPRASPGPLLDPELQPDPEVDPAGCVDFTRSYTSLPATVLLLIDQSQSMAFEFGESTRWDVLRQSIVDPEQGLLASLDASTRVGLMIYTGQGGFANPLGCPLITQVDFAIGNVDQARSVYLANEPMFRGDTPTGESIDRAALALGAIAGAGPKYILLATDGEPDTCQQPKPSEGMPQALQAAQRAFAQGLRVYTLGVSDGLGPDRVQQMANAGAGKDPNLVYGVDTGAEPPLFANSDPRQLAQQLAGVIGDVRTCTIDLGTDVTTQGALEGRLVLDGQALARDERNGWTFVDERTLSIHGAACDKILGDGERLQVRFPCARDLPQLR
ncbi:MAG TPA: vWA domain-containing protein, partial [Polyangiaceae bacterium]|nr:vWA domain-containing protein [Polyangiaceae bacterium]